MIDSRDAVRLVARREVVTRGRSRPFKILLVATAVIFLAFPLVMKLVHPAPGSTKVAVTSVALGHRLESVGGSVHQNLDAVVLPDPATARQKVSDGTVVAFVATDGAAVDATVQKSLPGDLQTALAVLAQQDALNAQITRLGGDPARVAVALASATVRVHAQQATDPKQGQKIAVAIAAGLLMYLILMTVGQMVAQGVVEEKSSRVVELLLATVEPWQLMAGKIVGVGALGLVQLVVPGILGVVVGIATGQLDISLAGSVGTLVWSLIWFVAGFGLYAMLFAAAGAMVSRQEDLGGLMFPILMPLIAGWVIGVSILPSNPDSQVATILSFVPLISPVLMPMRWALGAAPFWQVLVALAITVCLSVLMLRFAGRIYRNSVLRSGARVGWREALRAA